MKKTVKKISLNKETVRRMDNNQLKAVDGGISGSVCGWDTCYQICHGTLYC